MENLLGGGAVMVISGTRKKILMQNIKSVMCLCAYGKL